MKIGIDARMYGPEQGGIGRYLEQLIHNLEKIDDKNEYVIFLREQNFEQYVPTAQNFKKTLADVKWYGFQEQIFLPRILQKEKVDLTHFPHWNVPFFYKGDFVLTIHDLLLLEYPSRKVSLLNPITYNLKHFAFKKTLNRAVKKAKIILTPSECTKQDIIKKLGVREEKIIVTHLAPYSENDFSIECDVEKKYNLKKPYILYVGVAFPHKNLDRLVDAWKIFQEKYEKNFQLVLAGSKNYFYKRLEEKIQQENIQNVVLTGFVQDSDMPALYKNASLFVFPSLSEGFGIPPLEAMQYNVPVASSDHECMREILGDAAMYFNPKSMEDMADKIHSALTDEQTREKLLELSKKQLQKYSWVETAKKTLCAYQTNAPKSG